MREISLPGKTNCNPGQTIKIEKSLVVVGANGSGKTRFGAQIENGYNKETHRISAQKSLVMPNSTNTTSIVQAENNFLWGTHSDMWDEETHILNKKQHKWKGNLSTQPLDDFSKLLQLLFSYEFKDLIKNKNSGERISTRLDKIKEIWEEVLVHKTLEIGSGSIRTISRLKNNDPYNSSEMSDGERVIFYLIAQVACVREGTLIIIDEPEMHLHKSIVTVLWDAIENSRTDCVFVYLTHDLDFAASRQNSKKIWLKEFASENLFDYEVIENQTTLPEKLFLEILGSRKPVLFIEGDISSLDFRLYSKVFSEYTVMPVGPCSKVVESYKAFKAMVSIHRIESHGVVDRDRREDLAVSNFRNTGIFVTKLAESENFLLLEKIVKLVARELELDEEITFNSVREFVFDKLEHDIEKECYEYSLYKINEQSSRYIKKTKNFEDLKNNLIEFKNGLSPEKYYVAHHQIVVETLKNKNYNDALKHFNDKYLIFNPEFTKIFKLADGAEYITTCLHILNSKTSQSKAMSEEIKQNIIM